MYIGWDVEWLFGEAIGRKLKERYPYYPSLGTGVGLEVRMLFDSVQIVRILPDSPCQVCVCVCVCVCVAMYM